MAAADDRRAVLLDRIADHVLEHGLSASSLRPLAKAVGTSDRMLLYYFADKSELMAATLTHIAGRMVAAMSAYAAPDPIPFEALRLRLVALVHAEAMWPYMRLWLEIATLAAQGDGLYRTVGGGLGRGFIAWGAAQLDCAEAEREREAARLMIIVEGTVVLKSLGLDDVLALAG